MITEEQLASAKASVTADAVPPTVKLPALEAPIVKLPPELRPLEALRVHETGISFRRRVVLLLIADYESGTDDWAKAHRLTQQQVEELRSSLSTRRGRKAAATVDTKLTPDDEAQVKELQATIATLKEEQHLA